MDIADFRPGCTWFLDDRSKDDAILVLNRVLWTGDRHVLCLVRDVEQPLLVDIARGRSWVLNSDYDSWYATGDRSSFRGAVARLRRLRDEHETQLDELEAGGGGDASIDRWKRSARGYIASLNAEIARHCRVVSSPQTATSAAPRVRALPAGFGALVSGVPELCDALAERAQAAGVALDDFERLRPMAREMVAEMEAEFAARPAPDAAAMEAARTFLDSICDPGKDA